MSITGLFDVNDDKNIDLAEFGKLISYIRSWKSTFALNASSNNVPGVNATQLHNTLQVCLSVELTGRSASRVFLIAVSTSTAV